jgi:hypothetical protein
MLGIDRDAVAARAHAGLEALAPDAARRLSPDRRAEIADYLLRQQDPSDAAATRDYLAGSASARAFARLLADALTPVARDPLPDLPAPATSPPPAAAPPAPPEEREAGGDIDTPPPPAPPPVAPAAPARAGGPRSSRLGGVLILIGLGITVAVLLVVILNNNNSDNNSKASSTPTVAQTSPPATTTPQTTTTPTTTTPVTPKAQINLTPLATGSKAIGLAQVVTQGSKEAIALAAQNVAPNNGNAYVVWLYNSQSDAKFLGFVNSSVGSNGQFTALIPPGSLPANANRFKYLLVSLEPVTANQKTAPAKPTQPILRGTLKL